MARKNLELNRAGNVNLRQVALGDKEGSITFHTASDDHLGTSTLRPSGADKGRSEQVQLVRLDSSVQPSDRVDLVKIDVEGAEMLVLRGMTRLLEAQRPSIILELTDAFLRELGSSAAEAILFLKEHGYELYRIDWDGLRRLGDDESTQINVFAWPPKAQRGDRWREMLRDDRRNGSANARPGGAAV
jgi:FkbM family methyltransferase